MAVATATWLVNRRPLVPVSISELDGSGPVDLPPDGALLGDVFEALGDPILIVSGGEADDIAGRRIALANAAAPEHLELLVAEPWSLMPKITQAGAIFMGDHAAEVIGDYFAGPNHVLPTMRTARFASALSVQTFTKKISLIATSPDYARAHADKIARLARLEGLEAHARSVETRKK